MTRLDALLKVRQQNYADALREWEDCLRRLDGTFGDYAYPVGYSNQELRAWMRSNLTAVVGVVKTGMEAAGARR